MFIIDFLGNFQHIPSSFLVFFCFTLLFWLCNNVSIFIFFGWCELLLQLVLCLCVLFLFTFTSLVCIMPSLFTFTSFAYNLSTWCSFLHLTFITTPSHLHGACFYITCAPFLFLHCKCSCFPLAFFYIIFFFGVNLLCSWNYLVVSLIFVFNLCMFQSFLVSFIWCVA
jgi:hypothetical protein